MARVVHRRKNPPYALIIFAFLFLVSSALAVLTFNKLDKARQSLKEKDALLTCLAGDPKAATIGDQGQQILKMRQDEEFKHSVVQELVDREKAMRTIIEDRDESTAKAKATVQKLREAVKAKDAQREAKREPKRFEFIDQPLVPVIEQLIKMVEGRDETIAKLEKTILDKESENKQFKARADSLTTELASVRADLGQKLKESQDEFAKYQAVMDKKLAEAMQRWEQDRARLDADKTKNADTIAQQAKKIRELTAALEREKMLNRPRAKPREVPSLALKEDGKVLRVLAGEDVCYINMGRAKRVMPGLTLAVFAPGKGPKTKDAPKGKLIVTNVEGSLSECRIESVVDPRDPITIGDSVFNLVFSPSKTFTFVVEGKFNLDGTGRPSDLGTQQVKDLIKKYGGKVGRAEIMGADPKDNTKLLVDLDPEADFVVMGAEPSQPSKPGDSAEEPVRAAYREQLRLFQRYSAIRRAAASIGVPVLNTNRFLSLVGYTPKPPLR